MGSQSSTGFVATGPGPQCETAILRSDTHCDRWDIRGTIIQWIETDRPVPFDLTGRQECASTDEQAQPQDWDAFQLLVPRFPSSQRATMVASSAKLPELDWEY